MNTVLPGNCSLGNWKLTETVVAAVTTQLSLVVSSCMDLGGDLRCLRNVLRIFFWGGVGKSTDPGADLLTTKIPIETLFR